MLAWSTFSQICSFVIRLTLNFNYFGNVDRRILKLRNRKRVWSGEKCAVSLFLFFGSATFCYYQLSFFFFACIRLWFIKLGFGQFVRSLQQAPLHPCKFQSWSRMTPGRVNSFLLIKIRFCTLVSIYVYGVFFLVLLQWRRLLTTAYNMFVRAVVGKT